MSSKVAPPSDLRRASRVRAPGFTAEASIYPSYGELATTRAVPRQGSSLGRGGHLSDHEPALALVFRAEQKRIRAAIGSRAVAIEHVDSSAIPGLWGRREVDVLVGVRTADSIQASARRLSRLGYATDARPSPQSDDWRLMSRRGAIPVEVLIVEHGGRLWSRHLWLREYLRRDPRKALAYGRLKLEWAARHGAGTKSYKEAKRRFWATVEEDQTGS